MDRDAGTVPFPVSSQAQGGVRDLGLEKVQAGDRVRETEAEPGAWAPAAACQGQGMGEAIPAAVDREALRVSARVRPAAQDC